MAKQENAMDFKSIGHCALVGSSPTLATKRSEVQGPWPYDGSGRHAPRGVSFDTRTGSSPVMVTNIPL